MTPELWQRLKPLYHAALEMPIEARSKFVVEACGVDHELRSELTALLDANAAQTGHDVTAPLIDLKGLFPTYRPFATGELILGRFKIVRPLGSGGMGDVYEAMDLELGQVALKTIRADIAGNSELLSRFKREVQLARKVGGPYVCRIHELFVPPGDSQHSHPPFLTMEFLEGITLADKMSGSGPLPWREAKAIALEICSGLEAIHAAGIVHRDLKSRNIMLAERNGRTCAVLMDFGLASEVGRTTDASSSGLTRTGAVVGTPDYMAPEQFEGGTVSSATDIYALGVVLYEMLTGRQPFAGVSPIAAAVQRGRRLEPVTAVQPGVPRAWDEIVGKCLEYKADDRYQSAVEVQIELESLLPDGKSSLRSRDGLVRRKAKRSRLRVWVSVLAASILVAAIVFTILRFYPRTQQFASVSTEQETDSGDVTQVAISPDGKTLAEVKTAGGQHALWIRNVSTGKEVEILEPVQLDYGSLAFSRDGDNIYFVRSDDADSFNLYRVSVLGDEPSLMARNVNQEFSSSDDKQVAYAKSSGGASEVHVLTLATGEDSVLTKVAGPARSCPTWSPNGRQLAWVSRKEGESDHPGRDKITVFDLKSKRIHETSLPVDVSMVTNIAWLPSGDKLLLLFSMRFTGVRSPGGQIGILSINSADFRQLTNDMIAHSGLALSGDGKTIATLLQQSGSEIGFFDPLKAGQISSTRLPRMFSAFVWLDEDRLLTVDPWFGTVRRVDGKFADFDVIPPPNTHEFGMGWSTDSVSGAPAVCPSGELILGGELNQQSQLYIVDPHGNFLRTLVKTKHAIGNAFCNRENQLMYYGEDDSTEPSVLSASSAGGAPQRVMPLPHQAPLVYKSDGKLAAYVLDEKGLSAATIIDLNERKVVRQIPIANHVHGTLPHFTPDGKAFGFVEQSKDGFAIALQPVDGSASRLLTGWFKNSITDFGWSPSGKTLAVMWDKSTSDVALITDTTGKPSK